MSWYLRRMSNVRYPFGNQRILQGDIAWVSAPIVAQLTGSNYVYSSAHTSLADIPVSARIATSGTLTGRTATLGVADADDVTFNALPAGPLVTSLILYVATGVESTSTLLAYFDTMNGFPVSTNGSSLQVVWDSGERKIFKL